MEDVVSAEHRLTGLEQRCKSNTHRLDDLEKRADENDKLVNAVCGLQKDMEYTKSDVSEIKKDVKTLTDKPAKRWDGVVEKIILVVVAAVVAFLLAKVGL